MIKITTSGIEFLYQKFLIKLKPFELTRGEINTIISILKEAIEKEYRWVRTSAETIEKIFKRFNRTKPEGNFDLITLGNIKVKRVNGIYLREYKSYGCVCPGWHSETINAVRKIPAFIFCDQYSKIIFEIGQQLISEKSYLEKVNESISPAG